MRPNAPPVPDVLASIGAFEAPPLKVLHVASGGFSGATQVALDVARWVDAIPGDADLNRQVESTVALRSKKHLPSDRLQALRDTGLRIEVVAGGLHGATVRALVALMDHLQPDVVVGHGFPEHLLARRAALEWRSAGHRVALVQVEHNARERYGLLHHWWARRLVPHTAAFVGVSRAVAQGLRLGHTGGPPLPAARVMAIPNGIAAHRFHAEASRPWVQREPAILMAARFGAQKDPITLIRALEVLRRDFQLTPKLRLAGAGSERHRAAAQACVRSLDLESQVEFLGHRSDLPDLMQAHRVLALSTHFEGLPLVLAEGLAAGCAVVGSDVPAVAEVLGEGGYGWLATQQSPDDWARCLAPLLAPALAPELLHDVQRRIDAGAAYARTHLTVERMAQDHRELLLAVSRPAGSSDVWDAACTQPWLSILVPACNAAQTLPALWNSIETEVRGWQDLAPHATIEVWVVDDASDDDTSAAIQRQARAWSQAGLPLTLHSTRHSVREGVASTRNQLLEQARGTWIWFLDADDRIRPGGLNAVFNALHASAQHWPCVNALVVDHAVWREQTRWKHRLRGEMHRRSLGQPSAIRRLLGGRLGQPEPLEYPALLPDTALEAAWLAAAQWHPWGRIIRRSAWPAGLRFPPGQVFEDLALVPRLMLQLSEQPGAVHALQRPVVDYRSHPQSILGGMTGAKVHDWAAALQALARATPEVAPPERRVRHIAWLEHLAMQLLRLVRVGRRLGLSSEAVAALSQDVIAAAPSMGPVLHTWAWQPRRWLARRRLKALLDSSA